MATSTSTHALSKLDSQLTCAICLDRYTDPKSLPCLHSYCKNCINRLPMELDNGRHVVKCPSCQRPTQLSERGADALPTAFYINNLLEIDQLLREPHVAPLCHSHDNMPKDLYCDTCDELVCLKCVSDSHSNHKYDLAKYSHKQQIQEKNGELGNPIVASLQTVQQKRKLDLHLLHLILHGLPSTGKTCAKLRLTGQIEELHKRKPAILSDSGEVSYPKDNGTRSTLLADDIVRARIPATDTAVASKVIDQPWYLLPLPEELVLMATKMKKKLENQEDLSTKGLQTSQNMAPIPNDFQRIVTTAFKEAHHTDLQHLLEETLLYLIDSGGQPQFQELLPTLISGPSLFLLTFSLAVGLDAEFQVTFTDPNSRQEYPTLMKVSDALLQCLASICCTCSYQTNGENRVEVKPRVIFMATMKDLVTESKIDEIDEKLHSLLAPYKDEDIIVYNTQMRKGRRSCLFPVDSFTNDGIPALRQAVKVVAYSSVLKVITGKPPRRQCLCEVTLPAPTVALELVLRFQSNEKSVITLDECKRIARDCNISDADLTNVLWHLHHFTGSIRYYPKHDRLRNYVVTRPQALYDIPSTLLTDTFAFSKDVELDCGVKNMVWTRGVFTKKTLERLWSKDQDISLDLIIDFLLHLNIIARIQDEEEEGEKFLIQDEEEEGEKFLIQDEEEEGEKFFMPCALVCAATGNSSKRVVQEDSVLVCFKCNYTPKGTYSSLLACLLKKKPENVAKEKPEKDSIDLEWVLPTVKGSLCSNQATLRVKVDDDEFDFIVKLTIHHKFIEINVSYDDDVPVPSTKMLQYYKAILDHIQHTVKTVVEDLHYNSNAKLCDGLFFPCFCDHEVDAHAVKFEKRKGHCQGLKVKPAESWVQKWIKGTTTVNQPQPNISQLPPPVATENTMSVVGADPQATLTAGNKQLFVEVDDREQTLPAAQKPCFVRDDITTDSQTTCAGTKRPLAADEPTIPQLITVNKRDGTELRIIDTLTAHSKFQLEKFADLLLNDTIKVQKLKKQHTDEENFILGVLKYWLSLDDGGPALPRTWKALGQCVSNAGLAGKLAKAIRETYYPDPPASPHIFNEKPKFPMKLIEEKQKECEPLKPSEDQHQAIKDFAATEVTVVIQSCNNAEYFAALQAVECPPLQKFTRPVRYPIDKFTIVVGTFAGKSTAIVRTQKGADCRDDLEAVLRFFPNATMLLGLGVCMGIKHKLSDVLVGKMIKLAVNPKVRRGKLDLADAICREAKQTVRNVFCDTTGWSHFECTYVPEDSDVKARISEAFSGCILSSPNLLDDPNIKHGLESETQPLIGVEMEGWVHFKHIEENFPRIESLIIKGICDYGDGTKKKDWQLTAAKAALDYARFKLEKAF